jgi:SPP1 gp7 family putative phage head morphogenesis protein
MARRNPPLGRRAGTPTPRQMAALVAGWSPEQVRSALDSAARGDLDTWSRLVDAMLIDYHVRSTAETLITSVAGADAEWHPGDDSDAALAARDIVAEAWHALPSDTALRADIGSAVLTGVGVVQQTWGVVMIDGRRVYVPVDYEPVALRDIRVGSSWAAEVRSYDGDWAIPGGWVRTDVEPERWLVSYARFPGIRRTLAGALTACAWPWLGKLRCSVFELVGLEKFGDPVMALIGSQNGAPTSREHQTELVERLSSGESVFIEDGTSIQIIESTRQTGQAHADAIARRDAAISKAILGSTLNTEVGATGGNRAAAESQAETTVLPRQRALAELISDTLQSQWARAILSYTDLAGAPLPELHIVLEHEEPPTILPEGVAGGVYTVNEIRAASRLEPIDGAEGERIVRPADAAPASTPGAPAQTAAPVDEAKSALSGPQVTALAEVAEKAAQGLISRETAAGILRVAYGLTPDEIEQVLGPIDFRPRVDVAEVVDSVDVPANDVPEPVGASQEPEAAPDERASAYEFGGFLRLAAETQDTITALVGRPRDALARGVDATEDLMRQALAGLAESLREGTEPTEAIAAWAEALGESDRLATAAYEANAIAHMAGRETALFELDEVASVAASRPRYLARERARLVRLSASDERALAIGFEAALEAFQSRRRLTEEELARMLGEERERGVTIARAVGEKAELTVLEELERALEIDGLTIEEFADRIEGLVDADDLPGGLRGYAENAYRTTIATSYEAGRQEEMFDPEVLDLLGGFEWAAVGDERTRPSHAALDGVQFRAEDAARVKIPPASWMCRCEILAIDAEELDESRVADPSVQDAAFTEGFGNPAAYVRGG